MRKSAWIRLHVSLVLLTLLSLGLAGAASPSTVAAADRPVLYLTFDDGPSVPYTAQVLTLLTRYHAHATFFVVGQHARAYPGLLQAIVRQGSTLGNHTFDHRSLAGMSWAAFRREVQTTKAILGARGTNCLRPPYGATDANTRRYAQALGYRVVLWTVDPRDWARPGSSAIARRVLQHVRPGSIVILHDGGGNRSQTVAALATILRTLGARGYRFLPLCR